MKLRCMIFGHSDKKINQESLKAAKGRYAKQEYDIKVRYQCERCGRVVIQEEYY